MLVDKEASEKIAFKAMRWEIKPFKLMAEGKDVILRKALYHSKGVSDQRVHHHEGRRHNVRSKTSTER
ncbi:hypothetical protein VE03_10728, partial [Pseudogymnoascus sp. 23342-1-I1]